MRMQAPDGNRVEAQPEVLADAGPGLPSATSPTARLRQIPPAVQGTAAFVVYLVFSLWAWTHNLLFHPGVPQLGQGTVDPNFYIWCLRWWPYALTHGLNPLHSPQIGAPAGYDLAWATTVPPVAILLSPVTAIFGPVVAFNLLSVAVAPVTAWAMFVASRRLTGRFWPALAAGAVYGFSVYEMNHVGAGQPNLTANLLLPIMVYLVVLWREGKLGRTAFVLLFTLALVLQFLTFLEVFAQITAVGAAALVLAYAFARKQQRPVVARLGRQVGLAYLFALVLASPYLLYALTHYPSNFNRSPVLYSMSPMNLVTPQPARVYGLASLARYALELPTSARAAYIGVPLVLVLVVFAVTRWRSRLTWLAVAVVVLTLVLALGPDLIMGPTSVRRLPWARLWSLPIARSAEPYRFILLTTLVLALVVALWLAAPARSWWLLAGRWVLVVLAIAAVLDDTPRTLSNATPHQAVPAFFTTGEYRHHLQQGSNVLLLSARGNAAMLYQAYTDFYFRTPGGFINMSLTPHSDQPPAVWPLVHPTAAAVQEFKSYVRVAGIRTVLIEAGWEPKWMLIFPRMGLHGNLVGGMIVYRIPPGW
jgi:hypothetical protein